MKMLPNYPIYIISKGRWERRQTVKTMEFIGAPYKIVVEPKEYDNYAKVIDQKNIIKAPENFSELGSGSIPVRNYVWDLAIENGNKRYWILDDNIESIERFYNNLKIKCKTPTPFRVIEDFVDRYENIGLAGMHYAIFNPASEARPPLHFNTRVYSCLLIDTNLPFRWRGKYNEDTDLSLRVLKSGLCTVLFRTFLIGKRATQTQKGGNRDIYDQTDDRKEFVQSLIDQHPDVVKLTRKFNRYHHQVNYKPFAKNLLKLKDGLEIEDKINNYGLKLIDV